MSRKRKYPEKTDPNKLIILAMSNATMNSESKPLVAALMVIVIFGGSLAVCFWPTESSEDDSFTVTGEVTGLSSYNQPKLDIKAQTLYDHNIKPGALFKIETENATFTDAILLKNYNGIFMFDKFVNIESDGYISIGCVGKLIEAKEGSDITITHTGTSERYFKAPHYNEGSTNKRADYASDEVFANFYEVSGGNLKDGILYRSFSPLYTADKQARSAYVNELAEKAGIQFEIALSYNEDSIKKIIESQEGYCIDLCKEGNYVAPGMGYLYFQQKEKTALVLQSILDNDGAYLVHCNVGRDRTGFVILLLQALCGCSADEMKECEAKAFCNLYHIDMGTEEFRTIVNCTYERNMYLIDNYDKIPDIFEIDWEHVNTSSTDTFTAAYDFCTDYLGFSDAEIDKLIDKLCD